MHIIILKQSVSWPYKVIQGRSVPIKSAYMPLPISDRQ